MNRQDRNQHPLVQRLIWFVVLWLGGVGAVTILAYGLRFWIAPR